MKPTIKEKLPDYMDLMGLDEMPLEIFYTDTEPTEGLTPDPLPTPTREREQAGDGETPELVASPWGAACGNLVIWPLNYSAKGQTRAVLGGWDISARKFFRPDELSFSMPFDLFERMLDRYGESFLTRKNWATVKKKIDKSRDVWGR